MFPSLASSMSTSPAPTTPPTQNSLSNQEVDPTTALIDLMHQSLYQNATMIAQLNSFPSPQPAQKSSPSYQFKPQCPSFPKWDGTPPTTPIFLVQIATYKDKAFYSGVHDWTRNTLTNQQLSVAMRSDMLPLLPSSISSMLLNYKRFTSDGITMLC